MAIGVSVIICCYNSAERLPETLKHLAAQQVPANIQWEVIVVDNASTDQTSDKAIEAWATNNIPGVGYSVLQEKLPGKNNALKTGIAAARYEYLIICDDDNWLNPNYIATAFNSMNADNLVGIIGGCGSFEPELPIKQAIENLKEYYINGPQHWAEEQHWVYGAGAVYRKSVFNLFANGKWPLITPGRVGGKLNGGEDAEMCFIAYLCGYKVIANDALTFKHFVPVKRQNLEYILDIRYWMSYSNVLLYSYFAMINNEQKPIEQVLSGWRTSIGKTLLKQSLLLSFRALKGLKMPALEQKLSFRANLGIFYSLLHNSKKIAKHHYSIKAALSQISKPQHPVIQVQ